MQLQIKSQRMNFILSSIDLLEYFSQKIIATQAMEGLCTMIPIKRLICKRKKMKRRGKGIIVDSTDDGATHEGIKTVEVENTTCEFSGRSDCCICILTWNMNGKVTYEDIEKLLAGENRKFDLLVVGLQEAPRDNILQMLKNTLVDTHILLGKSTMQSVQLYVFGPKNSGPFIKDLKADKLALEGCVGGLLRRKKGAVAIKVNYKGIRLKFISSHLSAHARNVEKRNSQYMQITQSLFSKKLMSPYLRPAQVTFWLGDLNYRLEGINTFPARDIIHRNHHEMLTSKDQLLQEAERGQIFGGYSEGTLTFKPTYKYDIGSSNYDTSHKVRVPSWTDRILFKIEDPEEIDATLHSYESMESIHSSDHKPVKAHICLRFNKGITNENKLNENINEKKSVQMFL